MAFAASYFTVFTQHCLFACLLSFFLLVLFSHLEKCTSKNEKLKRCLYACVQREREKENKLFTLKCSYWAFILCCLIIFLDFSPLSSSFAALSSMYVFMLLLLLLLLVLVHVILYIHISYCSG